MSTNNKISDLPGWLLIGLFLLAGYLIYMLVLFLSKVFVFLGFNLFLFTDNLLKVESINPIILWGLLGLLIGSILGVIIAVKKYKLSKLLILAPLALLIIIVTILCFINEPTSASGKFSPPNSYESSTSTNSPKAVTYYTIRKTIFVRSAPSWTSTKLFTIRKGSLVIFIESVRDNKNNVWSKIEYTDSQTGNNETGYVLSNYLTQ